MRLFSGWFLTGRGGRAHGAPARKAIVRVIAGVRGRAVLAAVVVTLGLVGSGLPAYAGPPADPTKAGPTATSETASSSAAIEAPPTPPLVREAQAQTPPAPGGPPPSLDATQVVSPPDLGPAKQGAEVVDRRTATTKTFATDRPGEFVTELSAAPVHYQAGGRWLDIDTTLSLARDGRMHNKAAGFDLSMAADANDPSVARLGLDASHSVGFGLEGATKVKGDTSKDVTTYPGARKGTELRLTSRPNGLKEDLVLASAAAGDRFLFPLQLKGLSASIDASGNVIYRDEAGVERARTPHGYMADSNVDPRSGESATSLGVTFALVPFGKGGTALEVTLDKAWLNDPARVWPVVVDPEFVVAARADDTYVMSNFTRDNSSDAELKVGTYDGGYHIGRSYLYFDTAPIRGKVIQWGRLDIAESSSWNCGAGGPTPYRVVQGWDGRTMTAWPGAPIDVPAGGALIPAGGTCPDRLFSADMNGASANWASGAWTNLGIALVAPSESDNNYYKKFKSLETGAPPALHVGWTEPATAPSPPQNVVATARNLSASVTWAAPANNGGATVDNYVTYAYSYPSGAYANSAAVTCGTCTSATLSGLANGQQYYFVTYAHNAVGWGGGTVSNVVTPTPQPPGPPQNPSATPRNLSAIVGWTAPADNGGAAIQFYGVFAYTYPSYTYLSYTQGCATCTSVSVPNLTNGQQYVFGVYAYNGVNWGPGVGTNVVTPAVSTPNAPASVIASPGDASATVAWSAPTANGGSAITSSWVLAYTTTPSLAYANKYVQVCATCTSGTVTGLTNGVSYQFIAFATNSVGNGAYTWSNAVVPGTAPDLLAPTSVMASRGDRQVAVTWTRPGLRLEGLTSYVVKVYAEGNLATVVASATVTDPTATAVVSGLTNGQRYFATVTASTALLINVTSSASAPFVPAGPPVEPTDVKGYPGDRKIIVTWATASNNGSDITGYDIAVVNPTTGEIVRVVPTIGSGTEVTGLMNGTQYGFKVRAINALGPGPYSTTSSPVTPAGRPFPPAAVAVAPGNGGATVTWAPPTTQPDGTPGDNGASIAGYEITMSPGGQSQTAGGQDRSRTFTGMDNGTEYVFLVTATSASGTSDPSYATTVPAAPPATPSDVVASSRDGSAYVSWTRSSPVGVAVTYTVIASPGGRSVSTQSTSTVVDGLTNGQGYTFTVRATNTAGTSATSLASNSVTPQAIGVLPPPGPSCRASTLPAPPAEVRVGDSIQRRIDVPCMPAYGRVRMGFFIADPEVQLFPRFIVIGRGDGRGFDPNMTPLQNRFYIELDYTSGTGYVQVNKSCRSLDDSTCTRAQSLVNHFSSFQLAPDGTIIMHFSIGDAAVGETPFLGRVEVSGDLEIIPMNGNQVCFTGSASRYPSIEVYHDRSDGTTRTLAQVPQSQWGPIAMLGSDHAISGC